MAEDWQGFTDEDLNRLKGGEPKAGPLRQKTGRRVSSAASLKPKEEKIDLPTWDEASSSSKPVAVVTASSVSQKEVEKEKTSTEEKKIENDEKREETSELKLSEDPSVQLPRLELLQKQQKEIEEKNKKMEAALQKTINERYQKSQREAAVLKTVKTELNKLESILSSDVSILRNEIDKACRSYNDAKKRYNAAETEFVAAKVGLHQAADLKGQLMEHLCMIIQQSELRKAERLEELTRQLEPFEAEQDTES